MKVVGVIAEYNPFHNGHKYQLQRLKKETGADYIIIAMSGNFLQRGVAAMVDKYTRAKMALSEGADLVFELPVTWSTASAEYFAKAGVTLFRKTGVVTHLGFGAESDNSQLLHALTNILTNETEEYQLFLTTALKRGLSFPVARKEALQSLLKTTSFPEVCTDELEQFLNSPNNILALEYMKAIAQTSDYEQSMEPIVIKRQGNGYHDASTDSPLASATGIRNLLLSDSNATQKEMQTLSELMPSEAFEILQNYAKEWPLLDENAISAILGYKLLSLRDQSYASFADCGADLSNKIRNHLYEYVDFTQYRQLLKSKELTYTRISRALLHILLQIKLDDYLLGKDLDYIPYLRVLGFRKDASALLSSIKKEASVPLITKVADASDILSPESHVMFRKDLFATDVYNQLLRNSDGKLPKNDFTHELVIL